MAVEIIQGDCLGILPTLPAESVHCCVTSPPYWGLRDYAVMPQALVEPCVLAGSCPLAAVLFRWGQPW